jgi:hypothetical protein
MGHGTGRRHGAVAITVIATGLTLALAATALAAHPKPGKRYVGTITNVEKINGFSAPVGFKVSTGGTKLLGFKYGTLGCFGGVGGFRQGVTPYTGSSLASVGPIAVAHNGHFAVAHSTTTYHSTKYGYTYKTTSHVTGSFANSKTATGTITFSQVYTPKTGTGTKCTDAVARTFKVKLR